MVSSNLRSSSFLSSTCSSGVGSIGGGAGQPSGNKALRAFLMIVDRDAGDSAWVYKRYGSKRERKGESRVTIMDTT